MAGELEFAADLFDRATAETIAARLVRVLEAVAADPDLRVGELDMLAPGERHRLARGVERHCGRGAVAAVAGLFEAQVARTPDAVAVAAAAGS